MNIIYGITFVVWTSLIAFVVFRNTGKIMILRELFIDMRSREIKRDEEKNNAK